MPTVFLSAACGRVCSYSSFFDYFYAAELPPGSKRRRITSAHISRNMNVLFDYAVEQGYDYMFYTDDDIVFPEDTIMRCLAHGKDRVVPLVCHRQPPFNPFIIDWKDDKWSYVPLADARCKETETPGLLQVPSFAGAVGLVAVSVLKQMAKPIFPENTTMPDGSVMQGDMAFSKKLFEMGVETYVETNVTMKHMGTYLVDWAKNADGQWGSRVQIEYAPG